MAAVRDIPMLPPADVVKEVRKRITQCRRDIFCRAEMWAGILTAVTVENAHVVLDALPPEDQRYLLDVYAAWPPSLWSCRSPEQHPLCAAVEAWCRDRSQPQAG
jgi:hypothetical protein